MVIKKKNSRNNNTIQNNPKQHIRFGEGVQYKKFKINNITKTNGGH